MSGPLASALRGDIRNALQMVDDVLAIYNDERFTITEDELESVIRQINEVHMRYEQLKRLLIHRYSKQDRLMD